MLEGPDSPGSSTDASAHDGGQGAGMPSVGRTPSPLANMVCVTPAPGHVAAPAPAPAPGHVAPPEIRLPGENASDFPGYVPNAGGRDARRLSNASNASNASDDGIAVDVPRHSETLRAARLNALGSSTHGLSPGCMRAEQMGHAPPSANRAPSSGPSTPNSPSRFSHMHRQSVTSVTSTVRLPLQLPLRLPLHRPILEFVECAQAEHGRSEQHDDQRQETAALRRRETAREVSDRRTGAYRAVTHVLQPARALVPDQPARLAAYPNGTNLAFDHDASSLR